MSKKQLFYTAMVLGIAMSIFVFLVGAFAQWDINPSNWDPLFRGFYSLMFFVVWAFIAFGIGNYKTK